MSYSVAGLAYFICKAFIGDRDRRRSVGLTEKPAKLARINIYDLCLSRVKLAFCEKLFLGRLGCCVRYQHKSYRRRAALRKRTAYELCTYYHLAGSHGEAEHTDEA